MNYNVRKININDYIGYKKHIHSNVDKDTYDNFIHNVLCDNHHIVVIELENQIIGSGTLLIEKKLTHGGCSMGHIENILIDEQYRNLQLGTILVKHLVDVAKENKCYRIDLSCEPEITSFYKKCGFQKKIVTMIMLNEENFTK